MKTLILSTLLLGFLSLSNKSYADCKIPNSISVTNAEETAIDVLNMKEVKFSFSIPETEVKQTPLAKVTGEYFGFECFAKSVSLAKRDKEQSCWVAVLTWLPGADISGCTIEFSHPSLKSPLKASLHMNY